MFDMKPDALIDNTCNVVTREARGTTCLGDHLGGFMHVQYLHAHSSSADKSSPDKTSLGVKKSEVL
jgi:hypothetical protein